MVVELLRLTVGQKKLFIKHFGLEVLNQKIYSYEPLF